MRRRLSLLPVILAGKDDVVAVDPGSSAIDPEISTYDILSATARRRGIRIISLDRLSSEINPDSIESLHPWGWNHAVAALWKQWGMPQSLILPQDRIDMLRELAHRRTAVRFRQELCRIAPCMEYTPAFEISDPDEAVDFVSANVGAYLKAPWSSSGRGILPTLGLQIQNVRNWAAGIIRRQHSIMAEPYWPGLIDFASEWMISRQEVEFTGWSLFRTSGRGKYIGNHIAPQTEIENIIFCKSNTPSEVIIDTQRKALKTIIAPGYEGPVGIDMMISADGRINPCVEINLRYTMGILSVKASDNTENGNIFRSIFPKYTTSDINTPIL